MFSPADIKAGKLAERDGFVRIAAGFKLGVFPIMTVLLYSFFSVY